jgi:hypothetical protein
MQRVLKFPFWTRRLKANSQLNGSFSIGPPASGSRSFLLPLRSAVGTGTALHVNVETVEALNFGRMSPAETGQMQNAMMASAYCTTDRYQALFVISRLSLTETCRCISSTAVHDIRPPSFWRMYAFGDNARIPILYLRESTYPPGCLSVEQRFGPAAKSI